MRLKENFSIFSVVSLLLLSNFEALANIADLSGFGAKTSSLGGAGVAGQTDAFAAYYNPAGLALNSEKRLLVNWGLIFMRPNFIPINNVVTQNGFNADTSPTSPIYDYVKVNYDDTFGQQIGLSYRLFEEGRNLTLGMVAFLPIEQIASFDTGESYAPEYVLYRARTQRPQIELGAGINLGGGLRLGGGFHVGFTLNSNASVFINTKQNTTSSMRFISALKAKTSPYLGLLYSPGESSRFSFGTVFRFPLSSENSMGLDSAARAFGDLAAIDFNFKAASTLFYDPMALEFGFNWQYSSWGRFYAQLDYQVWNQFKAPALQIRQPETTACEPNPANPNACNPSTVKITPTTLPLFEYVNILIPRFGEEVMLSDVHVLRMGYAYRPSIFKAPPNGAGNYLDPPKHLISVGWGLNYRHFLGYEIPTKVDLNFAYQILETQNISKDTSQLNEAGLQGYKIGYPGYQAGGNSVGGGISLAFAL